MAGVRGRTGRVALRLGAAALILGGAATGGWTYLRNTSPDALARAAYERKDWKEVAHQAQNALRGNGGDPIARRWRARAMARLGRFEVALPIYDQLGPKGLEAEDLYLVGSGLMLQGKFSEANSAFEMALKSNPNHPEALQEKARYLAATRKQLEAEQDAEHLASLPGWETEGSVLLGLIREELLDPEGAATALSRALTIDPQLKGVMLNPIAVRKILARAYLQSGRPEEARSTLEKLPADGADPESTWLLNRAAIQLGDRPAFEATAETARRFNAATPMAFEPSPYVGVSACERCHADIAHSQQAGRHARTFHYGDGLQSLGLPPGPLPDPNLKDIEHRLTRPDPKSVELVTTDNRTAVMRKALFQYALGSGDRGLTPVAKDDKGIFREIRLSRYGDIDGWDRTTGHPEDPDRADCQGPVLNADGVRRCLHCHTTHWRNARDRTGPTVEDHAIGCERCHGPGGNHVRAVEMKLSDLAIGRPSRATPAEVSQTVCGQCHKPLGRSVVAEDPSSIRFQSATLSWSTCYKESRGVMGCTTCHSPHRDAEISAEHYETRCLACHQATPEGLSNAAREIAARLPSEVKRTPCPVNSRSGCLECHMPRTKTSVPHILFTDHWIRTHEKGGVAAE